eukprot:7426353-Alexandrium_andersonii.AAC.2
MSLEDILKEAASAAKNPKLPFGWGGYSWDSFGLAPTKAVDALSIVAEGQWLARVCALHTDGQ